MRSFWRIFSLEWTDLVRSRAFALLTVASVAWMFLAPHVLTGDGTPESARELAIRYSLGGVAVIVACALTAVAAGSVARERAAHRLQLTLVRPVRRMTLVLAKIAALSSVAALVLGLAAAIEAVRADSPRNCRHVYRPDLLSPAREAELLYDAYMKDPSTPEEAKTAPRSRILRLLAQHASENYQGISTNGMASWPFAPAAFSDRPTWIRLRFATEWNLRDSVRFEARLGDRSCVASNMTQTVAVFPLDRTPGVASAEGRLELVNAGRQSVMLRPRRDVEILVEADGFYANLVRAWIELVALVTALLAFGVFLGSALSRPVALFTVFVTLALSEMTPSILESYSPGLDESRTDAIAFTLTRIAAFVTRPVSSLTPLASLAADECVEPREVAGAVATDLVAIPLVFSFLAALVLARKAEDDI